ncbi:MAG: quinone-dependent dihydroorotate dehydrogenase [Bacteroidetes bacterium]|nr:quinone-dependent dihydroorotate dehydrogenase [Bacteroidota bacterium]
MYRILRSILFLMDAEKAHHIAMSALKICCRFKSLRVLLHRFFQPVNSNPIQLWNLSFSNRVGLGAGFDKNARYLTELETLGFGFVEIGTVTPLPQEGNPKPRLFRLPKDKALINRMGFNNEGVEKIAERLKEWRSKNKNTRLIIGGNIGKNKITPNENAARDYEICFERLYDWVDYFVVNVSSPNTPGLRELQEKESLRTILTRLQQINRNNGKTKPLLLKIAPDLSAAQVEDVIELALEIQLDGLVVSNTTIDRTNLITDATKIEEIGAGGLSGKPLQTKSNEWIRFIHEKSEGKIPIIGSGGIFTAEDAKIKLQMGASLIQVWTGFVYEGPAIVKKIVKYIN